MSRKLRGLLIVCTVLLQTTERAQAQFSGSRVSPYPSVGMIGGYSTGNPTDLPMLDPKTAQGYITIDGRAEVRVQPTEIRVVMAITSSGDTAQKCQQAIGETVDHLKTAWAKMGIANENIVVDFIAVLPSYEWTLQKRDDVEVGVEKKSGYHMQTNMHLAVRNDTEAQAALNLAFKEGVTDIIAFDYWSRNLDEVKVKAREQAVKAAKAKAGALFAVFADPPPVINVQEQTSVRYPESLYQTVPNSVDETVNAYGRRDMAFIHASRPRNTYYRGLYSDGDVQPRELPMHPEISVVSTVRLYFKSPAAESVKKPKKKAAKNG